MHTSVYVCLNWSLYGNAIAVATRPIARNVESRGINRIPSGFDTFTGPFSVFCHCLLSSFVNRIRPRASDSCLRAATDEKGNFREVEGVVYGTGKKGRGEKERERVIPRVGGRV